MANVHSREHMHLSADSSHGGFGVLNVSQSVEISTESGAIDILAADAHIEGVLRAGSVVHVTSTGPKRGIGLGIKSYGLHIEGNELSRIFAPSGVLLASAAGGDIRVDALSGTETSHLTGIITLLAAEGTSQVVFESASTFAALTAHADGGIILRGDVVATQGVLALDGNINHGFDYRRHLPELQAHAEEQEAPLPVCVARAGHR